MICILCFYHLTSQFMSLGGMDFNLLKIIMELIILLFIMIIFKYKEEIKSAIHFDTCQKRSKISFLKTGNDKKLI